MEASLCKKITIEDSHYPRLLKEIKNPPKALYLKGDAQVLDTPCFAIVGTRKASGQGLEFARRIAYDLAQKGLTIVSGLAQGIDGAAHKGALEARGKTIGVLASSLEERFFFPKRHLHLAKEMMEKGGPLISEYEKDAPALRRNFVARNRIVSGISLGVLVVEAPIKSGALITAEFARTQKRFIFAVPASPFAKDSQGTNFLIKQGAFLTESAKDILDVLEREKLFTPLESKQLGEESIGSLSKEEKMIVDMLAKGQTHIDKLATQTKVEVSKLLSLLIDLELNGAVKNVGGGNYILTNN